MCTVTHDFSIKLPKGKTFTAYKVFGRGKEKNSVPQTFASRHYTFKIGVNEWSKEIAKRQSNNQSGFQVFAKKEDAENFAYIVDTVLPLRINTKDIVKVGRWLTYKLVYEIRKFKISRKKWDNRDKEK